MVRRAAAAALIACASAFFAAPGTAAEQQHNYVKVHLHLNAYAHWGYCSGGGYKPPPVTYKTFSATCTGTRGAEIGTLRDEPFLTHGNFCVWDWQGDHLYLRGTDSHGGEWVLNGLKDPKWTHFKVTSGQILHLHVVTDDVLPGFNFRGTPGFPLSVDLSRHTYWSSGSLDYGFSIGLVGYVRVL